MNPLFDYMTDDEYDVAVESAMLENTAQHFDYAFALNEMNHKIRMSDIDAKAVVENYNDYDLEKMYTHEMQVYTESVAEVWKRFIDWLKGIWAAILGKVKPIKKDELDDSVVEVPADPNGLVKFSQNLRAKLKQFKEEHIDGNDGNKISIIFGGIAAGAIVGFAVDGIKNHVKTTKIKKKDIPDTVENVANEVKEIEQTAENIANTVNQSGNSEEKVKALEFARTAITKMANKLNEIASALTKKAGEQPDNNSKEDSKKPAENSDNTQNTSEETPEKSDDTKNNNSSDNKQGEATTSTYPSDDELIPIGDDGYNSDGSKEENNDGKKHVKLPSDWDKMNENARKAFLRKAGVSKTASNRVSKLSRKEALNKKDSRTKGENSVLVVFEHAIEDSERVFSGIIDAVNLNIDAYLTEASGADYNELQELAASLID